MMKLIDLLIVGAALVPFIFKWDQDLISVRPLTRQIFWTYAGYIFSANIFFAIICLVEPSALSDGSYLAKCLSLYLMLYWLARIILQFTYFDRASAPKGVWISVGETVLVFSFFYLTGVYGYAAWINYGF
jgi:hypothetical protein